MYKYTILAILNICTGIFLTFLVVTFNFTVLSNLMVLYESFGTAAPSNIMTYFGLGALLVLALANFFIGFKLFSKSADKEKYFNYGTIVFISTLGLAGSFVGIIVSSALAPIYNLST